MQNIDNLAALNSRARNPYEPFSGVTALFNADLYACDGVPREDWEVISPYQIQHVPVEGEVVDKENKG